MSWRVFIGDAIETASMDIFRQVVHFLVVYPIDRLGLWRNDKCKILQIKARQKSHGLLPPFSMACCSFVPSEFCNHISFFWAKLFRLIPTDKLLAPQDITRDGA